MATRTNLLTITDLRGGRNGVDSPLLLEPDQCVEAINVDWFLGLIGRKRKGAAFVSGIPSSTEIMSLARHIEKEERDNELWAFEGADGDVRRLAAGAWTSLTLPNADATAGEGFVTVVAVSFNGKLFLAYPNHDGRLHVWDGTSIRPVGIGAPGTGGTPPAISVVAIAGTGFTGYRGYHVMYTRQESGVTVRRGDWSSTVRSLTLNNQGGWLVTRGALLNQGETHWELYGSSVTGVAGNDPGPYYLIATIPIATTSYSDLTKPANFPGVLPLAPLIGSYQVPPDCRYLLVDEARMIMAGRWDYYTNLGYGFPAQQASRVWWTPVISDASGVGNDERLNWTLENLPFIDFDPGDGGEVRGVGGPLFDSPHVFKYDRIYKMVRTGVAGAPYRPVTITKRCGAIRHQTIVTAEDEAGHECLYFLSKRGPYRIGQNGLQYCGRDIEDIWATVDLALAGHVAKGAHGIYHADLHQVWWWINTSKSVSGAPDLKIVFDVKQGRFTEVGGVRRGWCQHQGRSSYAWCSVMYSKSFATDLGDKGNSLSLRPYIGSADEIAPSATSRLWVCDFGMQDLGTPNRTLIRTRVELPGGSVATHGGVIEGHLVGWGIPYESHDPGTFEIQVATIRDFGQERREATISIVPPVQINPLPAPPIKSSPYPWALLSHTGAVASDPVDPTNGKVTTPAIDTTDATLLVAVISTSDGATAGPIHISDSRSNIWHLVTRFPAGATGGGNGGRCEIWYAQTLNGFSTAHTFTVLGPYPAVAVAAFSGGPNLTLDVVAGATADGSVSGITLGPITPKDRLAMVVTGLCMTDALTPSIAGGFTRIENRTFVNGQGQGVALAYKIVPTPAPATVAWTWAGSMGSDAVLATFLPEGGAPITSGEPLPPTLRTIAPLRDLGAASVAALQIEITDELLEEQWALDQLVLRVRREEDR